MARERELSGAERNEREAYRKLYLKKFRENFINHLENIKIVYIDDTDKIN